MLLGGEDSVKSTNFYSKWMLPCLFCIKNPDQVLQSPWRNHEQGMFYLYLFVLHLHWGNPKMIQEKLIHNTATVYFLYFFVKHLILGNPRMKLKKLIMIGNCLFIQKLLCSSTISILKLHSKLINGIIRKPVCK